MKNTLTNDMMISDVLLRLKALENLLSNKGFFTKDEYNQELESLTKQIAQAILDKAGIKGNVEDIIKKD